MITYYFDTHRHKNSQSNTCKSHLDTQKNISCNDHIGFISDIWNVLAEINQ